MAGVCTRLGYLPIGTIRPRSVGLYCFAFTPFGGGGHGLAALPSLPITTPVSGFHGMEFAHV
jgi:hypothetical protein